MSAKLEDAEATPFEDALDKAGFGLYSLSMALLAGVTIISFACIYLSTMIIVPVSACDLGTTGKQRGILAAGPTVATIAGVVWGYLADQHGRKRVLMTSLLLGGAVNALASLSLDWVMLLVLQFIATMLTAGHYSLAMTLLSESVPLAKRNLVVMLVTSIFLLSQGVIAVLAMPIIPLTFSYHLPYLGIQWNSWRLLMLIYSLPSVISATWLYFMQESPKFLYSKGYEVKAIEALETIHRINNRRNEDEYQVKTLERRRARLENTLSGHHLVFSLFRPPLVKYTVIMSLLFIFEQTAAFKVWLPTIAHRFVEIIETGQGINMTLCDVITSSISDKQGSEENSGGACALNTYALIIVLSISVMISLTNTGVTLLTGHIGRRNMAMAVTAVTGTSGVLVNLVPHAVASALLLVLQLLGIVVLGLYTAMCVALFPTRLRALAVTLTMTGGRLMNFVVIQVINYLLTANCEAAFYVFGAALAFSAVIASFLPNDRKTRPPQHEMLHEETNNT